MLDLLLFGPSLEYYLVMKDLKILLTLMVVVSIYDTSSQIHEVTTT